MNYVDGEYIVIEIKNAFLKSRLNEAIIDMMNYGKTTKALQTKRVCKSFEIYSGMLSDQIKKQRSEPGKIISLTIALKKDEKYGVLYDGLMIDDRGKKTKIKVHGD